MMEVWRKEGPPTKKNPVGIDIPELLEYFEMEKYATEMVKEIGDCAVISFYY